MCQVVFKCEEGACHESVIFVASEGIQTGQTISYGPNTELHIGSNLTIGQITEGTEIHSIEHCPGVVASVEDALVIPAALLHTQKMATPVLYSHLA